MPAFCTQTSALKNSPGDSAAILSRTPCTNQIASKLELEGKASTLDITPRFILRSDGPTTPRAALEAFPAEPPPYAGWSPLSENLFDIIMPSCAMARWLSGRV